MSGHILTIIGFVFTYFVPGFYFIEFFFSRLPAKIKIPLYGLTSILLSTYLVYFVGLFIGVSRYSIILSFLFFLPGFLLFFFLKFKHWRDALIKNRSQLLLGLFVYLVFFAALYPAIFTKHQGEYILAGVNWQDTAMHLGIIQSLSQGNFPPQAPYYAGVPLNYYYFTDFHSAILVTLAGRFFPRVLVYDNPFFAALFAMTVFALAYEIIRNKTASVIAGFTAVFFGNLIFVKFFSELLVNTGHRNFTQQVIWLLSNRSYSMEYEKLFEMASMADYFLQNRPMMFGLPSAAAVGLILIYSFRKKFLREIFLAGLICGLTLKFQFFGIIAGILIFSFIWLFNFPKRHLLYKGWALILFVLPIIFVFLLFNRQSSVNNQSLFKLVYENFAFGPWGNRRGWFWYFEFIFLNFGPLYTLLLIGIILKIFKTVLHKITRNKLLNMAAIIFGLRRKNNQELNYSNPVRENLTRGGLFSFGKYLKPISGENLFILIPLCFSLIPFLVTFTIYKGDMFKFFYFMVIFLSVGTVSLIFSKIKHGYFQKALLIIVVFCSTATSFLTLGNSFFRKDSAYRQEDLEAGLWIRQNTPVKSVFLSLPTVHTPITQIGGRLRVLSYINWPYSHGYKQGADNVFNRKNDVESAYSFLSPEVIINIMSKYKADYVFYGREERGLYPAAESFLNQHPLLKKVYNTGNIIIYKKI